jgi:predicted dehydrogenase
LSTRLAIIGTGGFADHMIGEILSLEGVYDVVAAFEPPGKQTRGLNRLANHNVRVYRDLERMLLEVAGQCDVVYIPTPIPTHYSLACAALEAGLNVFLEKPPVPTIQQYDRLLDLEERTGKRIAVCFQSLYTESVQRLKTDLSSGKYGKVQRIRAMGAWQRRDDYYERSTWAGELKLDGEWVLDGSLHNPFAHMMAVALYLASPEAATMANPVQVQAELYRAHNIAAEDTSSVRVLTDGQVEILFNATLCPATDVQPTICIDCSEATITYYNYNETTVQAKSGATDRFQESQSPHNAMLKNLAAAATCGAPLDVPLALCRPFTLVVNGAFESSAAVHPIPPQEVARLDSEGSVATMIHGVDEYLASAHDQGKLLSEVNAPWAVGSTPFNMAGYAQFPHDETRWR